MSKDRIISIPDAYLIDFTFENDPKFCIIENELTQHDVFKHIGEQILKFDVSYKASGHKLKEVILSEIQKDSKKENFIKEKIVRSQYRNIDDFLEDIIFKKEPTCIVVIDDDSSELQNVLSRLKINTDTVIFQAFKNGSDYAYKFTPFQDEIREIEDNMPKVNIDELDTIIVPAREEGFNRVFLGENAWYAIKISSSMIPKIKYIASYQTAPVSAITYFAQVDKIEKYQDSAKYIIYFKEPAKKLPKSVKIGKNSALAPQAPRYVNFNKLSNAKTLDDIFK